MSKKIISLLLSLMLVVSMVAVAAVSVSAEVDEQGRYTPSEGTETYRYYFYMPSDWYNEYAETAGIYWWIGTDPADPWPGYIAHPTETENIYYCDVPTKVTTIIWNNGFDGGNDPTVPEYTSAIQTVDIACQFYSDGDSDVYSTDFYTAMEESYNSDKAALGSFADNFFYDDVYDLGFVFNMNNMIYVINPEMVSENYQGKITSGGEWYFYYGNGEYGAYPTRDAAVANGALYTSDYQPAKDAPATEPTTEVPATTVTEPATDAPETEPVTSAQSPYLTVNAISNYFPSATAEYNEETNEVTVTYSMKSTKDVLDTQWYLTYDSDVLSFSKKNTLNSICPEIGTSAFINYKTPGMVKYNASNLYLYDFTTAETPFVELIFDVKDLSASAPATTTIDLTVDVLRVSTPDPDTFMSKTENEIVLVDFCTVYDNEETATVTVDRNTKLTESTFVPSTEPETTEAPTTVEPTTTEEPTTVEPTTAEPTEKYPNLKVTATSNYFPEAFAEYDSTTNEVTVTYYLQTTKDVLDTQWYLKYDSEILTLSDKNTPESICPTIGTAAVMNKNLKNQVKYNATNLYLFDFTTAETPFAQFVFDVNDLTGMDDPVSTTIDLTVDVLRVSEVDSETLRSDDDKELVLVDNCIPSEDTAAQETAASKRTVLTESTVIPTTVPTTTEPTTAPVAESIYVVAGSETLCGVDWKGAPDEAPENVMVKDGDYYVKTFEAVEPADSLQIKVVENFTDGTPQNWIGDATGNNITFNVSQTCDVVVTYDPATGEIKVEGDYVQIVTELKVDSMRVVGNGDGTWLNGANWSVTDDSNLMTEISDKVYQITCKDIEMFDGYQFKFAANGSWADNWGGAFEAFDSVTDATYNGDNIEFDVAYDLADVTLTLDLTNFNYTDKTGATFTVTVTEKTVEPDTTVPETTVPETTVPETTVPETTVEPDTTVPGTTDEPSTDPTSTTGTTVNSDSTADTLYSSNNSNAVQTGDASFAVIILSILIVATGVMFVLRKRETF